MKKHIFVIVRIEYFSDKHIIEKERISTVKAYISEEVAEQEAARLNKINGEKNCEYFVELSRLYEE